jgi:hypothetical protein
VATTGKEPKKESAMIEPATGKKQLQASTTLNIFVAAMLLTLNSVIRNTIRFAIHPPAAMERPIKLPAGCYIFRPTYVTYPEEERERERERETCNEGEGNPPSSFRFLRCLLTFFSWCSLRRELPFMNVLHFHGFHSLSLSFSLTHTATYTYPHQHYL